MCNIVLGSGVKESDSSIHIFFQIHFHYRLLQNNKYISLCYRVGPCCLCEEKGREGKSLSRVRLLATPWTLAHQAPPSMGFSRQEYWSGLPFPSSGDLPNPGIKRRSPALQADALTLSRGRAQCGLLGNSIFLIHPFPLSSLGLRSLFSICPPFFCLNCFELGFVTCSQKSSDWHSGHVS